MLNQSSSDAQDCIRGIQPVDGHYDRVYPSRKGCIFAMARHIAIWVVLAAALVSVGYTLFAIPGQR